MAARWVSHNITFILKSNAKVIMHGIAYYGFSFCLQGEKIARISQPLLSASPLTSWYGKNRYFFVKCTHDAKCEHCLSITSLAGLNWIRFGWTNTIHILHKCWTVFCRDGVRNPMFRFISEAWKAFHCIKLHALVWQEAKICFTPTQADNCLQTVSYSIHSSNSYFMLPLTKLNRVK